MHCNLTPASREHRSCRQTVHGTLVYELSINKAGFFEFFNSIFGKIGRSASEEVLFKLIKSKCIPFLLYGTDVCPMNSADRHSLQFTINKIA